MTDYTGQTVGELVVERPSRSKVFEAFGIDYCCGGKLPLAEACDSRGLDLATVTAALVEADAELPVDEVDWAARSMTELADHIVATHHAYLRRSLPRLDAMTEKVATVHGERFAWLLPLRQTFQRLQVELVHHMMKEEQVLFPICRQLEGGSGGAAAHCGSVANPVAAMEHEHAEAGDALERMRELSAGFTPPADACNTFRAMLDGLNELETDLHLHIHKENNILFPRAIAAEAALRA